MPVFVSTALDNVSTAITCVDLSFHGQYLRQFAVDTSSHEQSKVQEDEKTFMLTEDGVENQTDPEKDVLLNEQTFQLIDRNIQES